MSIGQRIRGVKVLKAVSSPVRLQILNLLFDKGLLSYTELMNSLKMSPSRDAGRFAYHLKFLLKADLVEVDVESKKYCLTDLGKMVLDVAERIEKRAIKPRGLLVRTSRLALEEFDVNKIANSLVKEAKMPEDLAQKVAKEAEKRLLKAKTKYLTAPLVREFVNAILIEKGLEEYRHRLTRLGLPVYDVTNLIESRHKANLASSIHESAGVAVLEEYMLLHVFPRDIADAHLSGSVHIKSLSSWTLKPSEVMHDLRFFFHNGLNLEKITAYKPSYSPPKNMYSALLMILSVLQNSAKETAEAQTFDYFNIFLAPFIVGMGSQEIKEALRLFILNASQQEDFSVGLELKIPDFVKEKPAFGPDGKQTGKYGDFVEESRLLASLLIEAFIEESIHKPLLNPKLIVKLRPEVFIEEKAKETLLNAHRLALERGLPYFANLSVKGLWASAFSHSGFRLDADMQGDWEIDTLRTGCLGYVTVNLPRIACESDGDKRRFLEILKERLEISARALEVKDRALRQKCGSLLPFLMQNINGDRYFRLDGCSRIINVAGLKEACEAFCKSPFYDEKTLKFADEVLKFALDYVGRIGRRRKRLFLAIIPDSEASERLAQLDIEKYGVAKVRFSGTRENPFYSTVNRLSLHDGKFAEEPLKLKNVLDKLDGGKLTVIELEDFRGNAEELMSITKNIVEHNALEFFTYNRKLTYCARCEKSFHGLQHKCPSCEATSTLAIFDRFTKV
ncbi:MAG: anaerobic ribonucleoside-triphosphate reductase [Candidatus Bathyarchaeales archaeon]